ncbi:hypothetical protein SH1V18_42620 [Vallitalea longa]|uniref:Methyltransferase type 11 domain-containing protein n=1 Tax=Vallitalea longa TaxID=2936439 RepID=A0A9W5YE12_9FIRM|nr:class I SAM-dependent methyltransferase [Vallitalea longa]GKX31782.1 hypothetical protein SH1V18_42620 [Vallitalea longa]
MESIKELITESYNRNASLRSDIIPEWKAKEVDRFLSYCNKNHNKLLDLGAGAGTFAKYYTDKGLDVLCIDISKSMIELCRSKNLNAEVMDFYNLDIEDNQFDYVWSMNTLLHVPKKDIRIVLKEVKRILNDGGIFYLGMYGGKCEEGIYEQDIYEPKRFFASYTKDELLDIVGYYFKVEEYNEVLRKGDRDFLSCILRK